MSQPKVMARITTASVALAALVLATVAAPAAAAEKQDSPHCVTTYYIAPTGNDQATGTSPTRPWATVNPVNTLHMTPGICVLFKGGSSFSGGIYVDPSDAGDARHPVTIGSYGSGRATLSSGAQNGIFVYNTAGITIRDLNVVGNGYDSNSSSGLDFYTDLPNAVQLHGVTVTNVDVSGYGSTGIILGAFPSDGSKSGYTGVLISSSAAHGNADAGIQTYGAFSATATSYAHHNVVIRNVKAYGNVGRIDKGNNSGNGIVVGDADGAVVEGSSASDNGARNNWPGGGPVGIWTYDSNNVLIQHNTSYDNKSGTVDGDGFDLDGGVTNSVIQHNLSYNNKGAGYLVFQYAGARPLNNNAVRYNVSINDSRDGKYGAITVGSYGSPATNTDVYGNTLYMGPGSSASSAPAGIRVWENTVNARFFNNSVHVAAGLPAVSVEKNTTTVFQGNNYYSSGGSFLALVGGAAFDDTTATAYGTLQAWRASTGSEMLRNKATGSTFDPRYLGNPATSTSPYGIILRPISPLIGAGIDLSSLGIDSGGRDYFGVKVPTLGRYSIGASQL